VPLLLRKLITPIIICGLSISNSAIASAQQSDGAMGIRGTVSPALRLTVVGSQPQSGADYWRANPTVARQGFAEISLECAGRAAASEVTISLEIRTNVNYKLNLSLEALDGHLSSIGARVVAVRSSGAGIVPGAVDNCHAIELHLAPPDYVGPLLVGPRVSATGSFKTATNALLVTISLAMPEHRAASCNGHSSIRISLEPACSIGIGGHC
jgi:hypothetical protein